MKRNDVLELRLIDVLENVGDADDTIVVQADGLAPVFVDELGGFQRKISLFIEFLCEYCLPVLPHSFGTFLAVGVVWPIHTCISDSRNKSVSALVSDEAVSTAETLAVLSTLEQKLVANRPMSQKGSQSVKTEQVLEFCLGDETYCVSIEYVTEIVDMGKLTPIPNSPPHVEGVIDLRGNTTSIIDPKVGLGIGGEIGDRIVIFDSSIFEDDRSIGWAVDSVEEVSDIASGDVDDSPVDRDHIRGLIKRDSQFVVWIDPQTVINEFGTDEEIAMPEGQ